MSGVELLKVNSNDVADRAIKPAHLSTPLAGLAGPARPPRFKIVASMHADENWTAEGNATVSVDTTDYVWGKQSLKIETPTGPLEAGAEVVLQDDVIVRGNVGIWIKIHSGLANIWYIGLFLYSPDNGGIESSSQYYWIIETNGDNDRHGLAEGQWVFCQIPWHRFSGSGTGWTSDQPYKVVRKVRIRLATNGNGPASASFGPIVTEDAEKAAIIVGFDGAYSSQYEIAFRDFSQRGWPAQIWCSWQVLGQPGRMTLSQPQECYAAGWDITSHGWNSTNWDNSTTEDEIVADIIRSKKFMQENGFWRGAYFHSWLGNSGRGNFDVGAVIEKFVALCRAFTRRNRYTNQENDPVPYGLYDHGYGPFIPQDFMNHHHRGLHYDGNGHDGTTEFEANRPYLEEMITYKALGIWWTHQIREDATDDADITPDVWNAFVAWLDEKVGNGELEIITLSEWYNRIMPAALVFGTDGMMYRQAGNAALAML